MVLNTLEDVFCMLPYSRVTQKCSCLFLLGALKRLQKRIVLFVCLLLVIKVKHVVFFDSDHFSVVDVAIVVCIKYPHQFLQLLSCHGDACFLDTIHEFRPGDLFTIVLVQLAKEVYNTQASELYVLQQ